MVADADFAPFSRITVVEEKGGAMKEKPPMRDFIGLNTHTNQFRTDLYRPITRLLRDYHNFHWDVGEDTSRPPQFPLTQSTV